MRYSLLFILLTIVLMNTTTAQNGKYAMVNGLHMYYEIHGSGQPLVLIHGGGSTIGTSFGKLLPYLAKKHQIIAVELQAHGHSDNRDGRQISFEQDAADVAALLQQLKIGKADIMGFSNGGNTALTIALRHPELVNRLIIASSMYKKSGVQPGFWDQMKNATFSDMPEPYKKAFLAINPSQEALHTMFQQCMHRMQNFTELSDSAISSIQAPTLIIVGDQDVVLPEHAVEMYRRMPHAHLSVFPGGHGSYMGELVFAAPSKEAPVALPVIEAFLQ